jgi:hypothetical protein
MHKLAALLLITLILLAGCIPAPESPLVVTLATPANGSTVLSLTPILSWSSTGGATSYRLHVASDMNFQQLVVDASNLTDVTYTVPSGNLAYDRTYYWRVSASRGNQTSGWSNAWSFATPSSPTPPPVAKGTVQVLVVLDGSPWSGGLSYRITGPDSFSGSSAPRGFSNLPTGEYTLTYNFGGPTGATLASITPSPAQNLNAGDTVYFTLNFHSQSTSTITFNATLNGSPWSGPVNYSISGPFADSDQAVPKTLSGLPAGTYTLTYLSGGPAGATLASISPSPAQNLPAGGTINYVFNFFEQQASGTIMVNATLDGAPWQTAIGSGPISYTVVGPKTDSASSIPSTFSNQPAGSYTLNYNSGGPIGATLAGITPSPTQILPSGGTVVFTLNFNAQAKGTVSINATLNGEPWTGSVDYVVNGPYVESGHSVPYSVGNAPAGTYSVMYKSGGPPSSVFEGVSPPTQGLSPGGGINFTLMFKFQGVLPPMPPEPPLVQ